MFTGIVTHVGRLRAVADGNAGRVLEIEPGFDLADVALGASIAHAGVCLTVVAKDADSYRVEVSPETLARSTLGAWAVGQRINLERSLNLGDELGGHLVFGHVDALGTVTEVSQIGDYRRIAFAVPETMAPLLAVKGSVAVDGVSLTVNEATGTGFAVMIIPHTWQATTLAGLQEGSTVNLEADMLARYVARQLSFAREAS